ncbi:MAG: hypothetical protein ACT443_00370, partial [Gemmatimonadota bacterium]
MLFGAGLLFAGQLAAQSPERGSAGGRERECAQRIDLTSSLLSDARRSLERTLSLTAAPEQSYLFRARSLRQTSCAAGYTFLDRWAAATDGNRLQVLPVQVAAVSNSAYPRSVNDGGAWHGVGSNYATSAAVRGSWRFLHASIAPEVYYQQNDEFAFLRSQIPGQSVFKNPYHPQIDLPTRFGEVSFERVDLGQSYLQASYRDVSATFGTENLWIGGAEVYPILMSYTAPGFPHVRIGTQKPLDLRVVNLEFQMLFGSISESEFFDSDPENDEHYFTTSMLLIEPNFLPGFYLGVARALHDSASA